MKKIILTFITIGLGLFTLTGCGKVPKLENGQELVVGLKGKNITADDLYKEVKNRFARDVLIDMIDRIILDEKYPSDDSLKAQVESQITAIKQQTGDQFLSAIKSQWGLNSEEELYDFVEMSFKRNLAIEDYIKTTIKDDEIKKYYDDSIVGDIKASHILIKPEVTDSMTTEQKETKEEEALATAKEVIAKLKKGESFSDLAAKYSDDAANAKKGGDLGWFNKGVMDESFEAAAYALDKGKYSETPVKSQFGYHIILKTDTKAKASLEDSKEKIIDALVSKKLEADSTLNYVALEEMRKSNELKIYDSELNKQYDEYMKEIKTKKESAQ